ncbi:hypothetical protein PG2115B_0160 [Bifidobacterium pseudolongum subsp. globosum]|uniref:hypothetical protein n=1 Tax=Bifidobacterium pseudolongum TaxID=1694 RepID=UPI0010219B87|nr:hypothetical protein [Bifidobacterium pseudolongum]RYQ02186.1 hypothetical protein PG2115B_0160 [Bifidobacterium pseudolongum subsp. globosum]
MTDENANIDTIEEQTAQVPERDATAGNADRGRRPRRDTKAEAIKYRHQLRETEAERDRVSARFDAAAEQLYRQTVESMCSQQNYKLIHPEDFKMFTGKEAKDYMNDDGELDVREVQADFDRLAEQRPELFRKQIGTPKPDPSMGQGLDSYGSPTWADAFRS